MKMKKPVLISRRTINASTFSSTTPKRRRTPPGPISSPCWTVRIFLPSIWWVEIWLLNSEAKCSQFLALKHSGIILVRTSSNQRWHFPRSLMGPLDPVWIFQRCHSVSNPRKASIIPHKATPASSNEKKKQQAINVMISPRCPFEIMTMQTSLLLWRAHSSIGKHTADGVRQVDTARHKAREKAL